jgi:hypothetical protein
MNDELRIQALQAALDQANMMLMEQREVMRLALQQLNRVSGNVCEASHHIKGHQHSAFDPCPIEKLNDDAITSLREVLGKTK